MPLHSNSSDAVRVVTSPLDPAVLSGLAIAGASLTLWIVCTLRGRVVAALGLAWIWVAFLPTSGVVPLLHASTERNLYLALYGAASTLERAGRVSEARALYEQLHRCDGPAGRAEYAVAVARRHAREGDADASRQWLARVPASLSRRRGLALRIAQVHELLRRESEQAPAR